MERPHELLITRRDHVADVDKAKLAFGIFLIWPFLGFLVALTDFSLSFNRRIIVFFAVLYGFTYIISNDGYDASRYSMQLIDMSSKPFADFFSLIAGIYTVDTNVDIVQPFLTFLVSRLTDSHNVLFAFFAFIFASFQIRTVSVLYDTYAIRKSGNALLFLLFLPLILPISQINGFRMWTAAWVVVFGVVLFIYSGKKGYLIILLSASLIHFSFIATNIVLLVYLIVGNRNIIWIPLAIVTFFMSEFPLESVKENLHFLAAGFQEKILHYTNEQYLETIQRASEKTSWFIQWRQRLVFYFFLFSIGLAAWSSIRKIERDPLLAKLFSISLAFLSFSNVSSLLPSGGRFQIVFLLMACVFFIVYYSRYGPLKLSVLNCLGLIPILLYTAVELRAGSESLNMILFFPSPFIIGFFDLEWSFYDLFFR